MHYGGGAVKVHTARSLIACGGGGEALAPTLVRFAEAVSFDIKKLRRSCTPIVKKGINQNDYHSPQSSVFHFCVRKVNIKTETLATQGHQPTRTPTIAGMPITVGPPKTAGTATAGTATTRATTKACRGVSKIRDVNGETPETEGMSTTVRKTKIPGRSTTAKSLTTAGLPATAELPATAVMHAKNGTPGMPMATAGSAAAAETGTGTSCQQRQKRRQQ